MQTIDIVSAVDPGIQGAICFMIGNSPIVFDPPIVRRKKTPTSKLRTEFDLEKMRDLIKPFEEQSVIFAIEQVRTRPGESPIASFSFGEGYASWKACAVCFGFEVFEISPMKWKKAYPELTTEEMNELKEDVKALRSQLKVMKKKQDKSDVSTQINQKSRAIKVLTKDAARMLAQDLFPDIAASFVLKKHDGRAEACLIAKFVKEHYDELV